MLLYGLWFLLTFGYGVSAIGQNTCTTFKSSAATFPIVSNGKATPILLSVDEWPGVQRAAADFAADIQRVTGLEPSRTNVSSVSSANVKSSQAIIVGTLGKSSLIDQVVNRTGLDVSSIDGQWESFLAKEVSTPLPGVSSAYVIIGADKRGTIFALYDHSEQFGESTSRHVESLTHVSNFRRCLTLVLVRSRCGWVLGCCIDFDLVGGRMSPRPSIPTFSSHPQVVSMARPQSSTGASF